MRQYTEVQLPAVCRLGFIHLQDGAGQKLHPQPGPGQLEAGIQIADGYGLKRLDLVLAENGF